MKDVCCLRWIEGIAEDQLAIETMKFCKRVNGIEKKDGNNGTRTEEMAVLR